MLIDVCVNQVSPTARCCVLNPRTIKYVTKHYDYYTICRVSCGVASATFLRLISDQRSVILKVTLDGKVPPGRCFVPIISYNHLGKTAILSVPTTLPFLQEVSLVPVHEEKSMFPPDLELLRKHLALQLDGTPLSHSEPLILPANGTLYSFIVNCVPHEGIFSCAKSKLSILNNRDGFGSVKGLGFQVVGGLSNVIDELVKTVKIPLLECEKYRKFGVEPPKGILLYGPPGTGKTLIVKALAEELPGVLIESVKGTDLSGNDSDSKIHSLFQRIRRECVENGLLGALIFIDEIDSLCPSRESGVSESERRAVASMLTEMDGLEAKQGASPESRISLVIVGATNRPNALDIALRRPGRFEREIEIPPPDSSGRAEILHVFAKSKFSAIWAPTGNDISEVSNLTQGFVGADLLSLLTRSALKMIENGGTGLSTQDILAQLVHVRPSALRELAISVPTTHWADIGGYTDVKSQLIEAVIWPVVHAETFREMRVDPPRGVLLYGPPGCSKTMMARAVATESAMNFISVKGSEVFSKYVGDSEQAIRNLFRKARQASPCVIFFDEIDSIATHRESGDSGVSARVLTSILTEMDGVSSLKQVVVIAATNRPQVIDPALLRPGRLDRLVYVGLPDDDARESILASALGKIPHQLGRQGPQYMEDLAGLVEGYTGAEIVMVVKEAAIECMRRRLAKNNEAEDLASKLEGMKIEVEVSQLQWGDVEAALSRVRPRTDPALVESFDIFRRSTVLD